jgi:hypothetical protein
MTEIFKNLLWLLLLLGPLLFLQRKLHREIQGIILLITHRADITMLLFSIIFLPGVLIHELSHYITARILGVRTGNLSLVPRTLSNGKIQLGYVETVRSDVFRDALIGVAPFLTGSIFVALAGVYQLRIDSLITENVGLNLNNWILNIGIIYDSPDFWLWFYLTFTVSSTMMPSASDRRAWLPMAVLLLIMIGATILIGIGPWLLDKLSKPFTFALESVIFVLSISVIFHSLLLLPIWFTRQFLERLTGYEIG